MWTQYGDLPVRFSSGGIEAQADAHELFWVDETEPVAISFETFRTKFKYDPWTLMADGVWDSSTAYFAR